jgi:hypothetical protein
MSVTSCGEDRVGRVRSVKDVLWDEFATLHEGEEHADIVIYRDDLEGANDTADAAALAVDQDLAEELIPLWERIHGWRGDGRTALCLSGGGIRSAAFNLGVLQALARLGLLDRFHYLATVSGGGYIGSWLSVWRRRAPKGLMQVVGGLCWPDISASPLSAGRPRSLPHALRGLRLGTSYLTPRMGVFSPDTWTGIVLWVRNLLLD